MADFRKWMIALAVVLLFAGLANAQTGGGGSTTFSCSVNTSNTPTLRSEGITEQVGDIEIICSGGAILSPGTLAPAVNITVSLTSQVTSRLLSTGNVSEALLLIDEPNSTIPPLLGGFGTGAPFIPCPNPGASGTASGGCAGTGAPNQTLVNTISGFQVGVMPTAMGGPSTNPAWNTFQGVVNGNQVTFYGVPIVPPGTNSNRTLRITNIRVNASGIGGGSASGSLPVQASILTSNPSALPITNPTPIVGFVQQSLTTSVGTPNTFPQCTSQPLPPPGVQATTVTFKELFASAFKTRVDPTVKGQSGSPTAGQGQVPVQNVPGQIYNSESGFTPYNTTLNSNGSATVSGPTYVAPAGQTLGIADFGTRFTAVFNNIPAGVRVFVSAGAIGGSTGQATAVSGEAVPDGASGIPTAPPFDGTSLVEITPSSGSTASATWESITNSPTAIDTYVFGVYIAYTASPGTNSPAAGTATVNLRYGPASTVTTASASAPEPRFLDTSSAKNAFSIGICRTVLLFPFVTNQAGFDTGIAISNTSTDPFGTVPQAGTCSENWFGAAAPATPTVTPTVATGTSSTTLASITVPGFQGYMIAVCNFQYAHGFAFISDVGARNLAMGYLALVIPDPSLTGGRGANVNVCAGGGLQQTGTGNDLTSCLLSTGEQLTQ